MQAGLWADARAERGEEEQAAGLEEVKVVEAFFDLECRLTAAMDASDNFEVGCIVSDVVKSRFCAHPACMLRCHHGAYSLYL